MKQDDNFVSCHPGQAQRDPGSRIDLTVITTGGTIDGADSDKGTSRLVSDAVKWLKERNDVSLTHIELMNKDSRQITDKDRQEIIETVISTKTKAVLITHGTFTICETGRALKHLLPTTDKTIFLIGAWVPFGEINSDASAQMKFALEALKSSRQGIFIAMDEVLWDPNYTDKYKDSSTGNYQFLDNRRVAQDTQSNRTGFPLSRE